MGNRTSKQASDCSMITKVQ